MDGEVLRVLGAVALPASKKSRSAVSFRGFYGKTFTLVS